MAAGELTVASPLNQSILNEACTKAGSSARVSEERKHASNDMKCSATRHNSLRDCFADFCHRAYLAPKLERGCGLTSTKDRSHPADVLVPNWSQHHLT